MSKLKVLELFGGIGACSKALERLGIDYEKAAKANSNSQLYKQAGNSIVVNVLEAILKELLLNE
jgi:site-specific DNA-cytosine methylase